MQTLRRPLGQVLAAGAEFLCRLLRQRHHIGAKQNSGAGASSLADSANEAAGMRRDARDPAANISMAVSFQLFRWRLALAAEY